MFHSSYPPSLITPIILFNSAIRKYHHAIFFHPPITYPFFSFNIILSILFLNVFDLFSSLNANDQVSYPYKLKIKFVSFLLIFLTLWGATFLWLLQITVLKHNQYILLHTMNIYYSVARYYVGICIWYIPAMTATVLPARQAGFKAPFVAAMWQCRH